MAAKRGRKKIIINWELAEKLCSIMCTQEEISSILCVSVDTLARAIKRDKKGASFAEFFKKHSAEGFASLRRVQYSVAVEGKNPTMLIWLGKQFLGQTDRQMLETIEPADQKPVKIQIVEIDGNKGKPTTN